MLEYDRIDISEGIDVNKTNASKECDLCHYLYFKDIGFKYEPYLCNGCHDLMQKAKNFNDIANYRKPLIFELNNIWQYLAIFGDLNKNVQIDPQNCLPKKNRQKSPFLSQWEPSFKGAMSR